MMALLSADEASYHELSALKESMKQMQAEMSALKESMRNMHMGQGGARI